MNRFDHCRSSWLAIIVMAGVVLFDVERVHAAEQSQSRPVAVWGHERLAWDQRAASSLDLGRMIFTAVIDNRFEEPLEGVVCSSTQSAAGYECSSRLPRMAPGTHSIELTARAEAETDRPASPLSLPLYVTLQSTAAIETPRSAGIAVDGVEIQRVHVELPLSGVVAIAPLPDGRVFVGDRDGRIILTGGGRPTEAARLRNEARTERFELLALTLDPEFDSTRALYAIYVADAGTTLARLREANGVLVSHVVIRSGLPVSADRTFAAMGIGPDRKIYVALPGETEGAARPDGFAGKILRMNLDGSTPDDRLPAPVFAEGIPRPVNLSWSADNRLMWLIGIEAGGLEIRALSFGSPSPGATVQRYSVPAPSPADGRAHAAAANGEIVVAAKTGSLLHIASDTDGSIRTIEWLLRNHPADVQAIGFRPAAHDVFVSSPLGVFRLVFTR